MAGALGLPLSSKAAWRERLVAKRAEEVSLVVCARGEMVGHLSLYVYPEPRMRHAGHFGMAVRYDWQGKGVGTTLLEAALDLADNWLGLTRLDLRVYVDNGAAIALYRKFGFEVGVCTRSSPCEEGSTWTLTSWPASTDTQLQGTYPLTRMYSRRRRRGWCPWRSSRRPRPGRGRRGLSRAVRRAGPSGSRRATPRPTRTWTCRAP